MPAPERGVGSGIDHHDFGLNQSKIMKRDRFKQLARDVDAKALTLLLIPLWRYQSPFKARRCRFQHR